MTEDLPAPSDRNFLFYDTENGTTRVQLLVDGQTVWMPQKAIAELFETSVANINTHIRNILGDSEVEADSVIKDYLITAADGKSYKTKHRGTEDTEFSSAHPLCDLCASVFQILPRRKDGGLDPRVSHSISRVRKTAVGDPRQHGKAS